MKCEIENCERVYYAKGLCEMHYARKRHHGDPLKTKLPRRLFEAENFIDCGKFCVEWDGREYPRKRIDGKTISLSRLVLETKLERKLKAGQGALHTCDNPKCINGNHLYEGTQLQNMQDREMRGRSANPKGCLPNWTKLNPASVNAIRYFLSIGIPYRKVAKLFNVSGSTIHHIKKERSWKET